MWGLGMRCLRRVSATTPGFEGVVAIVSQHYACGVGAPPIHPELHPAAPSRLWRWDISITGVAPLGARTSRPQLWPKATGAPPAAPGRARRPRSQVSNAFMAVTLVLLLTEESGRCNLRRGSKGDRSDMR